ncbi:MAG: heterodisulfide reductase-related iron-sulfur binding cluster, partial [Gammaproteobacteria bacterium]|nr:heterodisulfide reductase-related iron-sulfur binding cluster [Gammaproteobacteria bacterium]
LCNSFPTLFDLVDESKTMEVNGVDKGDYWKVVDHCYLCDMCFMTKCPYVPPHPWNVDFPHLMLRAKAVKGRKGQTPLRDKVLSSTDAVGGLAATAAVAPVVNAANRQSGMRVVLEKVLGVHRNARVPEYQSRPLRKRLSHRVPLDSAVEATESTKGRVVLFATCYGNYNEPWLGEDLIAVFEHNDIAVTLAEPERCCGMPKLELGDLEAVAKAKEANIPVLVRLVDEGYDIVAPIPSCVLMFKQELPLLFPDDEAVAKVRDAIFDPFEYLMLRHKAKKLKTDFKQSLGSVAYHVACHQRVQNIGLKTRDVFALVPDTSVTVIERCSGHDGTYAVKTEFHQMSMKIGRPVVDRVKSAKPDYYTSDCAMAARHIEHGLNDGTEAVPPLTLLRKAYGI